MSQINKLPANCIKLIVIDIRPSVEYRDDVITIKLKEQSSIFFVFWEAWLKVPGKHLLQKPHISNRYWVMGASLKLLRNDDVIKSKNRKIGMIFEKPLENYCHEVCLVFFYAQPLSSYCIISLGEAAQTILFLKYFQLYYYFYYYF